MGKSNNKRKTHLSTSNNLHTKLVSKKSSSTIKYEKNKLRKKNPNVFHFNLDSSFIYESRLCIYFYNQLENKNNMKPNSEDIIFLKNYGDNINSSINTNYDENYIEIPKNYALYFQNRKAIIPDLDENSLRIKK